MSTGALIVLEGADGVGKTVAARALAEHLGRRAILVREPGGSTFAELMRSAVLGGTSHSHMAEALAFLAAKADLIESVIKPALRTGTHVVADRFTRSLLAYQGGLRGISTTALIEILAASELLYMPHLEIILQAVPATRLARRQCRRATDALEAAADQAMQKLDDGYTAADDLLFATRRELLETDDLSQADVLDSIIRSTERYLTFHGIAAPSFQPWTLEVWRERMADRAEQADLHAAEMVSVVKP